MASSLQNLVTSWTHSPRGRGLENILEVVLTALADGLNVGMVEGDYQGDLKSFCLEQLDVR